MKNGFFARARVGFLLGMVMVLGGFGEGTVEAASETVKDPLIEHLEFIGYQCDQVEQGIRAKHPSKIHIYITFYEGGIRLQTGFPGKPIGGTAETRYRVSNRLIKHMKNLQVYWSEDGNLFAMSWMPGTYEKSRFSVFIEAWEKDTALLRQSYDELKPFLKEETSG